jgi:tetratricopeptide (TPR) repeat protein
MSRTVLADTSAQSAEEIPLSSNENGENGESGENDMDATVERIERLFDGRRYAEVVELCSVLLAQFPTEFRLYYHRAQAKTLQGDTGGAIDDLTSAIAHNPDEPALFYFRGLWALDEGDQRSAANDLLRAIEAEGRLGTSYYVESARLARAVALLFLGDFGQVELECRDVRADFKSFVAGRQWAVSDVLAHAVRRQRPSTK